VLSFQHLRADGGQRLWVAIETPRHGREIMGAKELGGPLANLRPAIVQERIYNANAPRFVVYRRTFKKFEFLAGGDVMNVPMGLQPGVDRPASFSFPLDVCCVS
jgi:hypothetical protein